MSKRGRGSKAPTKFEIAATLALPPDIWCPNKARVVKVAAGADSRVELFTAALISIMRGLGWQEGRIMVGLLVDFLNHFPDEARTALALGIVEGLGMIVRRKDDTVEVDMSRIYNRLAEGAKGEKRTPGGLILPGR